jgi:hypothetical protein
MAVPAHPDSQPASAGKAEGPRSPKPLERYQQALRSRTAVGAQADSYARWVEAYIRFHCLRHPRELGPENVRKFLAHLRRQPQTTPAANRGVRPVPSPTGPARHPFLALLP